MAELKNNCVLCGNAITEGEVTSSEAQRDYTKFTVNSNRNAEETKNLLLFLFKVYALGFEGLSTQNSGSTSLFERDYDENPKDRIYFCARGFQVVEEFFLYLVECPCRNESVVLDMFQNIKDHAANRFDIDEGKITQGYEDITDADGIYINMRNMIYTYKSDTQTKAENVESTSNLVDTENSIEAKKVETDSKLTKTTDFNSAEKIDSDSTSARNEARNDLDRNDYSATLVEAVKKNANVVKHFNDVEETAILVNNRTTRKRKPVNYQELMSDDDNNQMDREDEPNPTNKNREADSLYSRGNFNSGDSNNVSDNYNDKKTRPYKAKRLHSSKETIVSVSDPIDSFESRICPHCKKLFENSKEVDNHLKSEHKVSLILSCNICGRRCGSEKRLKIHKDSHQNKARRERNIPCSKKGCGWLFIADRDRIDHENKEHRKQKNGLCHKCGNTFGHRSSFVRHERTCQVASTPFKCPYKECRKRFTTKRYLNRHVKGKKHRGIGNKIPV